MSRTGSALVGDGLDVRSVLEAVREANAAIAADDPTDDPLRGLLGALVPRVADCATIFVVGNDGHLHERLRAPPYGEGGEACGEVCGSDHTAAVAVRTRGPAGLGPAGRVTAPLDGSRGDKFELVAAAFPFLQDDDAVGALYLERVEGRRYLPGDVDLLLDVGERMSQALEVLRLRREVRAARRAKSDFLAVVSHELRTPLTAVVGYADILEAGISGAVTEKQRRQLVRIKESAWDLLELIDGILGYARYEGERPDLNLRTVNPEALVQDAVRLVEGAADEKGLVVTVESDASLSSFQTDPEKARRILFHLLSNAVKFTHDGEVRTRIASDPDWLLFSVADTGIGVRPEERTRVFEPFWQGERPETRTAGGAGIGLSLAQKLAELLGGSIEVESEVGKGSTFTLRLPREGPQPAFP